MANKKRDSKSGYHNFVDDEGQEYGSFAVLYLSRACEETPIDEDTGKHMLSGWYWVSAFPGCLFDGEPTGPFGTSNAAYTDAIGN